MSNKHKNANDKLNAWLNGLNIPMPNVKPPKQDKTIPLVIKFDEDGNNMCPICNKFVETDDNYCRHCGQRIYLNIEEV